MPPAESRRQHQLMSIKLLLCRPTEIGGRKCASQAFVMKAVSYRLHLSSINFIELLMNKLHKIARRRPSVMPCSTVQWRIHYFDWGGGQVERKRRKNEYAKVRCVQEVSLSHWRLRTLQFLVLKCVFCALSCQSECLLQRCNTSRCRPPVHLPSLTFQADCGSVKDAGVPAEESTEHYLRWW